MLDKNMLKVASRVLGVGTEEAKHIAKPVERTNAYYFYDSKRGGKQVIVDVDGSKLAAGSSVNYEKLVDEFKDGARN